MMIHNSLDQYPALPASLPASLAAPVFLPDEIKAYCVQCKTHHTMISPQLVTTKSGKSAARGKCPICRTTMMKFLPNRYV